MNSVKHILLLTPGFPANEADTTCIPALQEYVRALAETHQGLKLSVLSLQYPGEAQTYEWHGIPVYASGGNNRKGLGRLLNWRRARKIARGIERESKIDLVHSFWMNEAALLGHGLAKRFGCKHFCTLMGQDARRDNGYLKILEGLDIPTVAISAFQARTWWDSTGKDVKAIIPWGLQKQRMASFQEKSWDMLGVGSLIKLKAFDEFVRVAAQVREKFPQLKAAIIGEGPERDALEDLIEKLGVGEIVQLLGELPREQVLEQMLRAKVLLHPSHYEGFGLVFAEALNSGMSVVSRMVGAAENSPRWAVGEGEGEFAEAVLSFLEEDAPEERFADEFSIEETVNGYWELYQS